MKNYTFLIKYTKKQHRRRAFDGYFLLISHLKKNNAVYSDRKNTL